MYWDVLLERVSKNRLNPEKTRDKLLSIASEATANRALAITARYGKGSSLKDLANPERTFDDETGEEGWVYRVRLRLTKENVRRQEAASRHYEVVLEALVAAAKSEGWTITQEKQGKLDEESAPVNEAIRPIRPAFEMPRLDRQVMDEYFGGVFERDAHIRIIYESARSSLDSIERNKVDPKYPVQRSHILLKGKPAGCKTTLFERFKAWFDKAGSPGADDDKLIERVMFVDGPTMTKAGLENWLLELAERNEMPEFVVIEEIEKQDLGNLMVLLSLMGSGQVNKLNARVKNRRAKSDTIIWATCNDEDIIRRFRNGALWSRFTHKLHCSRPSRDLMHKILLDRIERMGGNFVWADKAIVFAYDTFESLFGEPLDDPREVIGLLDGRDRLEDDSWQRDLIEVYMEEKREKEGKKHHPYARTPEYPLVNEARNGFHYGGFSHV